MILFSYFVLIFIIKITITKFINIKANQIANSHKYSTIITIILMIIYELNFGSLFIEEIILIISNFLIFSYIFITFPGGYASSVRLKILSRLIKKNRSKEYFEKKFNDTYLFNNRFSRLKKYKLILKKKNKYYLQSEEINFFVKFININRSIFKKIKKNN
tara:strand:- start:187 stop:666 length:480 start_codon:yes stop_codon:yes gene_type:complete